MRFIVMLMLFAGSNAMGQEKCASKITDHLDQISTDRKMQESSVTYPLSYEFFDDSPSDLPAGRKSLTQKDVESRVEPIFPLLDKQQKHVFKRKINEVGTDEVEVILTESEKGTVLIYNFRRVNDCWKMSSLIDHSL